MTSPRVSVVVPVYNLESLVGETLSSLQAQTYKDYEALIVDDGSRDGSGEAIEPFLADPRFKYVYKDNGGAGAARNTALELARGEWFAQLDGDDLWLPEKLELQMEIAESDPQANLIYGNVVIFGNGIEPYLCLKEQDMREGDIIDWLYVNNYLPASSVMVKTEDLRAIGGYAETRLCEDYEVLLRLAHFGMRARACKQPIVKYRVRPGSLVSGRLENIRRQTKVMQEALDRENRPHLVGILRNTIRELKSREAYELARQAAKNGDPNIDKHLWECWRLHPGRYKVGLSVVLCWLSRATGISIGRNLVLSKLKNAYTSWEIQG